MNQLKCSALRSWREGVCGDPAFYKTPSGPMCERCGNARMTRIRNGNTFLNVMAEKNGVSVEELLSEYVRIE